MSNENTIAEYLILVAYKQQFISHSIEMRGPVCSGILVKFPSFRRPVSHAVEKKATKF